MPGHETVPPDPEDVRARDENARRPGSGAPGEDRATGPQGAHGERDPGGASAGTAGRKGDADTHEQAEAAAPYTEPGDRLPARRLSDVHDEEAD